MSHVRPAPVVVGVDGAAGSEGAVRYALAEARRLGTAVRLVHVVPSFVPVASLMPLTPSDTARIGSRILARSEAMARELPPDIEVEVALRNGARSAELSRVSRDAPLLVLGRTERSPAERVFAGDTVAAVASRCSVPVVSVPGDWRPVEAKVVLVGIRSRQYSETLLAHAFALAAGLGARVLALHAWRLASEYDDIIATRTRAEEWTRRSLDDLAAMVRPWHDVFPDTPVETRAVHDQPTHALVTAARDADLLVLVRRPRDIPALRHLGATGRAALHAAPCPVVVVPPEAKPPHLGDLPSGAASTEATSAHRAPTVP